MPVGNVLSKRKQRVLEIINKNDYMSIRDLVDVIQVSEATVRRELDELSLSGHLGRVHGGAIKIGPSIHEMVYEEKKKTLKDEKQRIAKKAATMVQDGNSVFLDSGSTAFFVARELTAKKSLMIVTDNLDIAYSVKFHPSTSVIITGGLCRGDYKALSGSLAEESIRKFHVDIAFAGCDAIDSTKGLYNANYFEVGVKQEIVKCGKKTVLVSDHSKFSISALAFICPINQIDCIISDTGLSEKDVQSLTMQGVELELV